MTKYFFGLLILILLGSCTPKGVVVDQKLHQTNCLSNGVCTFEVFTDSILQIKEDAYGLNYPELQPQSGKLVLKFEYQKATDSLIQDGHYREIIWVSIDKDLEQISLKNDQLSQARVALSRICNCRGATGTYRINKGQLRIQKKSRTFKMDLEIQSTEVPHIIERIQESFKI